MTNLLSLLLFLATCYGFTVHRPSTLCYQKSYSSRSMTKAVEEQEGYSGNSEGMIGKIKGGISSKWRRMTGKKQPGNLILIKSGEHTWNFNGTFTGWCDVDLTDRGQREMEYAGRLLLERGYVIVTHLQHTL